MLLPSLSSSNWVIRSPMETFSSLARSLALTASDTISCHSRTWLWVSSALPDSLACQRRRRKKNILKNAKQKESINVKKQKKKPEVWPEMQSFWWTAPGRPVVFSAAPHTPPAWPRAFLTKDGWMEHLYVIYLFKKKKKKQSCVLMFLLRYHSAFWALHIAQSSTGFPLFLLPVMWCDFAGHSGLVRTLQPEQNEK